LEKLIRELQDLQVKDEVSGNQVIGAILAAAVRFRQTLEARALASQALAASLAMQPNVDAAKLHADFLAIVKRRFPSEANMPVELKDIAAALELVAADRG
jgi:hypothetical protein